jgi:hypothetical protein
MSIPLRQENGLYNKDLRKNLLFQVTQLIVGIFSFNNIKISNFYIRKLQVCMYLSKLYNVFDSGHSSVG